MFRFFIDVLYLGVTMTHKLIITSGVDEVKPYALDLMESYNAKKVRITDGTSQPLLVWRDGKWENLKEQR